MCTIKELHRAMKDKLIEEVNRERGRNALAAKVGCSPSLIHGILDEREFPSKKAFELWFGKLDLDEEVNDVEAPMIGLMVNDSPEAVPEMGLPFEIDCEEFETLKAMMKTIGYEVRIVKNN